MTNKKVKVATVALFYCLKSVCKVKKMSLEGWVTLEKIQRMTVGKFTSISQSFYCCFSFWHLLLHGSYKEIWRSILKAFSINPRRSLCVVFMRRANRICELNFPSKNRGKLLSCNRDDLIFGTLQLNLVQ